MIKSVIRIALSYFLIFGQTIAYAQSTAAILPQGVTQFSDNNGKPLTSGKVFFYVPSTTTTKTTWQNSAKSIANANPVILDGGGRAIIYGDGTYRQIVKDRNNNTVYDAVTASAGTGGGTTGTGDGDLVGTIKPWAGLVAPNQYAFAYGQEISRTTYSTLFTAITLNQSIVCASGSPVATGFADTSQIPNNGVIESICFAPGTLVSSKTATSVTFNHNATISTTDNSARIFLYGNGNGSTTFNLPDLRGYVIAGRTNMGGTTSTILTEQFLGSNPQATGAKGGSQSRTLITANFPPYTPIGTIAAYTPAGTISAPTITNVFSSSGTNSYTPAGTISTPTITNAFSSTGSNSYTPAGTNAPSALSITNGTSLIQSTGTVLNLTASGALGQAVNLSGTAAAQAFTGTGVSLTSTSSTPTLSGSSVTLSSSASIPTFSGTAGTPIFTGTAQGGISLALNIVQPTQTLNYIIKITPDTNSAEASGVTSLGSMIGDIACGTGLLCTGNIISVSSVAGVNSLGSMTGSIACGTGLLCTGNVISTNNINNFNVISYGADNAGVADSTTAFTNAIAAACSNGGGNIVGPIGTYKTTTQISILCDNINIDFPIGTIWNFVTLASNTSALLIDKSSAFANINFLTNVVKGDTRINVDSLANVTNGSNLLISRGNSEIPPYQFIAKVKAVPVVISGTTTNGSATVNMAPTTGVIPGMTVSGVGIPINTFVGLIGPFDATLINQFTLVNSSLVPVLATASGATSLSFGVSAGYNVWLEEAVPFSINIANSPIGVPFTSRKNFSINNVTFNGSSSSTNNVRAITSQFTSNSSFNNLTIRNFKAAGLFHTWGYGDTISNLTTQYTGGNDEPDWQDFGSTNSLVKNANSQFNDAGPNFAYGAYNQYNNITSNGARSRATKLGSVLNSTFTNIQSTNAGATGLALSAHSSFNIFNNLTLLSNGQVGSGGPDMAGIWTDGTGNTDNTFTNFTISNNTAQEVTISAADVRNNFSNGQVGDTSKILNNGSAQFRFINALAYYDGQATFGGNSNVVISSGSVSSSTATGALTIAGGVGIGQTLFTGSGATFGASGNVSILSGSNATSIATGALTVVGGISTQGSFYGGGLINIAGAMLLPGLASTSAAQTGTLCWATGTGNVTVDTTTTCLLSGREFKHDIRSIPNAQSLKTVLALKPSSYFYNDPMIPDEQIGFIADEVVQADKRLVSLKPDGTPRAVRYQQLTANLAGAIQALKADNDNLRLRLEKLEAR